MGNCLSSQAADDLSLLNDSDGASLPGEPPPPYQQQDCPDGSQRGINFIEHKEKPVKGCFAVICPVKRPDSTSEERDAVPVYHPTPSQTRLATQLTEEEQVWIAQRIGLIHHLPKGSYDPGSGPAEKKLKECVICMLDFVRGDHVRFLPCMHIYHVECIDDWLMRSFTCPSCMEPVDAALLSSYETN